MMMIIIIVFDTLHGVGDIFGLLATFGMHFDLELFDKLAIWLGWLPKNPMS